MLIENLLAKFPSQDNELVACLQSQSDQIKTANDFFQIYAENISNGSVINVYSSSSWGICQQMLGKLNDSDSDYIDCRSGSWSCTFVAEDKFSYSSVTFRDVAEWLVENFPN